MSANDLTEKEVSPKKSLEIVSNYCNIVKQGLFVRWRLLNHDLSKVEFFEVVAGLLSRQANLTIQLAKNPGIWNPHIATLIFRAHIDAYITLAWILESDCIKRSQDYILHGLGQEKLQIEHLRTYLENEAPQAEKEVMKKFIRSRSAWLNSQLFDFLTQVDIGSWSGKSIREMASEAKCIDIYNFAYSPFSNSAHSTWPHIARYDLRECHNPVHKRHRVPYVTDNIDFSFDDLILSAKYVQKAYCLIDKKLKMHCQVPLPKEYLLKQLRKDG